MGLGLGLGLLGLLGGDLLLALEELLLLLGWRPPGVRVRVRVRVRVIRVRARVRVSFFLGGARWG